jgi:phosphoglucomutase
LADGIVITPSHNPPEDGGIKYNPPSGGPADTAATAWIEHRANALIDAGNAGVKRVPLAAALRARTTHRRDFVGPYVADLPSVVDLAAVKRAGLRLGVDPMGGANVGYWEPIVRAHGLRIEVVNPAGSHVRPATLDHDGRS